MRQMPNAGIHSRNHSPVNGRQSATEVQRHIAVVPHVPSHDKIVRNAHGEFQRRDEQSAAETLEQPVFGGAAAPDRMRLHGGTAVRVVWSSGYIHGLQFPADYR